MYYRCHTPVLKFINTFLKIPWEGCADVFHLPFWVFNPIPFEQAIYLLSKKSADVNFEAFVEILWQFKDC